MECIIKRRILYDMRKWHDMEWNSRYKLLIIITTRANRAGIVTVTIAETGFTRITPQSA